MEDMELSAEDIVTLRDALSHSTYDKAIAGNAILDRLSPEQPDEVTVWTRKLYVAVDTACDFPKWAEEVRQGMHDEKTGFITARQVLSELIASKDAEIEQIVKRESEAVDQLEKALSELAALRAEIGRLKAEGYVSTDDLYEWYKDGMRMRESGAHNHYATGSHAYFQAVHGWVSRDLQIALAKASPTYQLAPLPNLKAAERNPAEVESLLSGKQQNVAGEVVRSPGLRSSDGSTTPITTESEPCSEDGVWSALADAGTSATSDPDDAPELTEEFFERAEIRDGEKIIRPASGTMTRAFDDAAVDVDHWMLAQPAPVVEVTQARECVKEIFGFTDETLDAVGADKQPIEIVGRFITEAEARGRREALASVRAYVEDQYNQYLYRGYLVEEIDRLMTEVK